MYNNYLIKKILGLLCFFLVLVNVSLTATEETDSKWKRVSDDRGTVNKVTVTIINNTKNYRVKLKSDVIGIPRGLAGLYDYTFTDWIQPGPAVSVFNDRYAPDGDAVLLLNDIRINTRLMDDINVQFDGKDRDYPDNRYSISIKATPVLMFYPRIPNFSSLEGPWTYPFYNYTITINPN